MRLPGTPSRAGRRAFAGYDGAPLRLRALAGRDARTRAHRCLFSGRGEFIEKYFEVVADLRRRGFAVAAMDWRGQGLSQRGLANPRKGHIADFSEYDHDLLRFMKDIVLPDCPPRSSGSGTRWAATSCCARRLAPAAGSTVSC